MISFKLLYHSIGLLIGSRVVHEIRLCETFHSQNWLFRVLLSLKKSRFICYQKFELKVVREFFVLSRQISTRGLLVHLLAKHIDKVINDAHLGSNSAIQMLFHSVHDLAISTFEKIRV